MKRFTFDVEAVAHVEVVAETEEAARIALRSILDTLSLGGQESIDGINLANKDAGIPAVIASADFSTDEPGADVIEEEYLPDHEDGEED